MVWSAFCTKCPALCAMGVTVTPTSSQSFSYCLDPALKVDDKQRSSRSQRRKRIMEFAASIVATTTAGIQVVKKTKGYYRNYKDADELALHAQHLGEQQASNESKFHETYGCKGEISVLAKGLFEDKLARITSRHHSGTRKERIKWILSRKSEYENAAIRSNQVETSLILNVLLTQAKAM